MLGHWPQISVMHPHTPMHLTSMVYFTPMMAILEIARLTAEDLPSDPWSDTI
jgi:hypothetical protein